MCHLSSERKKKQPFSLLQIIKWIPLLLALALIIGFTLQNGPSSARLSSRLLDALAAFLKRIGVAASLVDGAWWNDYKMFRRLAHVVEYFLLGLSSMALAGDARAPLFCAGVSLCDELLKSVTPGKEFDFLDMAFDAVGYLLAAAVCAAVRALHGRKRSAGIGMGK